MRRLGLHGVVRGKVVKATHSDKATPCPLDRVKRQFQAERPNALWVSDFTYVSTWQGMVYVAFVVDVHARRIVGWKASTSMTTDFVLDALEAGPARPAAEGRTDPSFRPRPAIPESSLQWQPQASGTGHAGLGALVQPQAIAGADRVHPASGSRSGLLSAASRSGQGGLTQTKRPPRKQGRFSTAGGPGG